MDLSLQVCNIGWGLGCGHGVGKDELCHSHPSMFFLLHSQRQFYFQSSPESQPQILFQNFSFWDEVVSREVTPLPSCCWETLILPCPLLSALWSSLFPQLAVFSTVSSWIGREREEYWESCFEERLQEFLACEHALGVGDVKEPDCMIHCSRSASTAASNPLDEPEQTEESYSRRCPSSRRRTLASTAGPSHVHLIFP